MGGGRVTSQYTSRDALSSLSASARAYPHHPSYNSYFVVRNHWKKSEVNLHSVSSQQGFCDPVPGQAVMKKEFRVQRNMPSGRGIVEMIMK